MLDLFCGSGWGVGAGALGLSEIGVDHDPAVRATRDGLGLACHRAGGVDDIDWAREPHRAGLVASPPCQPFARLGTRAGARNLDAIVSAITAGAWRHQGSWHRLGRAVGDERAGLVLVVLHAARMVAPDWIVAEQVAPVAPVWAACAGQLARMGYSAACGVVDAETFGVPATRARAILFAHRHRDVTWPAPICAGASGAGADGLPGPNPARTIWGVPAGSGLVISTGDTRPGPWGRVHYERSIDLPAPAVDTKAFGAWKVHRPGARPSHGTPGTLTFGRREASLAQTFDPDTPWGPHAGRQIGNAVPPALAIALLGQAAGLDWRPALRAWLARIGLPVPGAGEGRPPVRA